MFKHVGLNPERRRKLAKLPETMSELTRRRLSRLKYQDGRDVRNVPNTWASLRVSNTFWWSRSSLSSPLKLST